MTKHYLTEKGRNRTRELLKDRRIPDDEIHRKYEFRSILPEEAEEAAEIEQICFPPNEACKKEHMLERIEAASDLFFIAVDLESGKMAGFLNGIATNTMEFRDEFFTDAGKVKWSVKGSGVMVKNGVATAKSLSKTDKKGNVNPAVVTLSCGKQTYSIQVYVSE